LINGLNLVGEFFGDNFPQVQILKGLTFFDDGDLHRLEQKDRVFLIDEVKRAAEILGQQDKDESKQIFNDMEL